MDELFFYNEHSLGFAEAVKVASMVYHGKFGFTPNLCYHHPSLKPPEIDGVRLIGTRWVSYPSYLFLSWEVRNDN